eukprot:COSAG01_NODE_20404_length_955_cov_2.445093_1_plen_25_part_10
MWGAAQYTEAEVEELMREHGLGVVQ